jgi:ketosteroid isomerase-like protein
MSQENVDRFLESMEAFNRRDLDAFLAFMDPEVEFVVRLMEMEGRPYLRGHDGIREWWRGMFAVFPDFEIEVLEARDLGDSVIAALRMRGHGGDSGVPFNEAVVLASKARDGKATWWETFRSEAEAIEALEAAGLSE